MEIDAALTLILKTWYKSPPLVLFFSFDTKSKQWASKWDQSHLCSSFRLEMAAWWRARGPGKHSKIRWFWHFTCVQPWLYIGCSLWLAMFRFNQEKIAINELSDAIFRFQVAFTVVKICRFLMSQLAWKTLYLKDFQPYYIKLE